MILLTLLTSLLILDPSFADVKVAGNGGDAVVCRDPDANISHVQIYDYFEAKTRNLPPRMPNGETPEEIALKVVDRLQKLDPIRHHWYRKSVKAFSRHVILVEGPLPDIPDSLHKMSPPKNCAIEQLAIREELSDQSHFVVDRSLWNLMNKYEKAGAILHEVFYEEAAEHGAKDSVFARYFHSLIANEKFSEKGDHEYFQIMSSTPYYPIFYLKGLYLQSGFEGGARKQLSWARDPQKSFFDPITRELIRLSEVDLPDFSYPSRHKPMVKYKGRLCSSKQVEFNADNGVTLLGIRGSNAGSSDFCQGVSLLGQRVSLETGSNLELNPKYIKAQLAKGSCFMPKNGKSVCGTQIKLNTEGSLIEL